MGRTAGERVGMVGAKLRGMPVGRERLELDVCELISPNGVSGRLIEGDMFRSMLRIDSGIEVDGMETEKLVSMLKEVIEGVTGGTSGRLVLGKLTLGSGTEMSVGRLAREVSMPMLGSEGKGMLTLIAVSKLAVGSESDESSGSVMINDTDGDGRISERELSMLGSDMIKPVVSIVGNEIEMLLSEIVVSIDIVGSESVGLSSERAVSIEMVGNENGLLPSDGAVSIEIVGSDSEGLTIGGAVGIATVGSDREIPVIESDGSIEGRLVSDGSPKLGRDVTDRSAGVDTGGRFGNVVESDPIVTDGMDANSDVARESVMIERGLDTE